MDKAGLMFSVYKWLPRRAVWLKRADGSLERKKIIK